MKKYSNKGFTAIEMMVTLVVATTIAGIGLFNYTRQIPRYELRQAGRDLTSQLRLLRQVAVTQGQRSTIVFDVADGHYEFSDLPEQALPTHIKFGLPAGVNLRNGNPYGSEEDATNFTDDTAAFLPSGLPGAQGTIYMTNAPFLDEAVAISVSITGRVKLFEWNGHEWES